MSFFVQRKRNYDQIPSNDPKDYVWAFDNKNFENDVTFRILAKNGVFYNFCLSRILNIPKEFIETPATYFMVSPGVDVRKIMKELGFEYSQMLYDEINEIHLEKPEHCQCYRSLGYHIDEDIYFLDYYDSPRYEKSPKKKQFYLSVYNKMNERFKLNRSRYKLIIMNKNAKCYNGVAHIKIAIHSINENFYLFDLNFVYDENNKKRKLDFQENEPKLC